MKGQMLDLEISVRIMDRNGHGQLNLTETLQIPARSFTEMARILGQFQDLANKIRTEQVG